MPNPSNTEVFYNQPLFTTLLTLALGGLILDWLKVRWARVEKRRDKTLEFLEATGDRLNNLLSLIFGTLATENLGEELLKELRARRGILFEKRFAVRLGADAYLRSNAFCTNYEFLITHLYELVSILEKLAKHPGGSPDIINQIRSRREAIAREWPIEDDPPDKQIHHSNESLVEVHRYARMLWHRAIDLISLPLQEEIGSKRQKTPAARKHPTLSVERTETAKSAVPPLTS
jgi:hypothetical protein